MITSGAVTSSVTLTNVIGRPEASNATRTVDPRVSFAEVLQQVAQNLQPAGRGGAYDAIRGFQHAIADGKQFSPIELVSFQVQASRLHLKVELAAKVGDAVHGTVRRLQQG